jgi:hypothetical protein
VGEKIAGHRRLLIDQRLYRRPGRSMNDFVNETHVEIRRADGGRLTALPSVIAAGGFWIATLIRTVELFG